ncbi:hypothetical protein PHSC3_001611 [Chlamydiales bacterium STE3]|nr:hypothetical protein PHSC3_001611 [Chlamydiales bacterium STE3]
MQISTSSIPNDPASPPVGLASRDYLNKELDFNTLLKAPDTQTVAFDDFKRKILNLYGLRLVNEMEESYLEESFCRSTIAIPGRITVGEVKQRLISLAALAKKEDLKNLFDAIDSDSARLGCIKFLSDCEIACIKQAQDFDSLTDKQIDILMKAFRSLPNGEGKMQAVSALFYPLKHFPRLPGNSLLFQNHLTMLRAFERVDHFKQNQDIEGYSTRLKLAPTEHMSREIAYGIPLNQDQVNKIQKMDLSPSVKKQKLRDLIRKEVVGILFPTLDEKGQTVYYEVKSATIENGLVAFFCAPFTKGQWGHQDHFPVKALFRGTWCLASIKRNAKEGLEVGRKSFIGLCDDILESFHNSLPDGSTTVSVSAIGHSLGGVDSMRFAALIAKVLVGSFGEKTDHLHKIICVRKFSVCTWNSPGVLKSTCREYNQHVSHIQKSGRPIDFSHVHVKVGEDVFQNFGNAFLGWIPPSRAEGNKKIKNTNTTIVKFYFKRFYTVLGTTWFTHRLPCLSVDAKENFFRVKRYKINRKLGPRNILRWIKMIAKAIFRRILRIPKKIAIVCKGIWIKQPSRDLHEIFVACSLRTVLT